MYNNIHNLLQLKEMATVRVLQVIHGMKLFEL